MNYSKINFSRHSGWEYGGRRSKQFDYAHRTAPATASGRRYFESDLVGRRSKLLQRHLGAGTSDRSSVVAGANFCNGIWEQVFRIGFRWSQEQTIRLRSSHRSCNGIWAQVFRIGYRNGFRWSQEQTPATAFWRRYFGSKFGGCRSKLLQRHLGAGISNRISVVAGANSCNGIWAQVLRIEVRW